jgi:Na+/H+ antiporter NhaD/arsenite permease-like protein
MNPVPTLMCIIFYANLGGALTLIGDPPNVIIGTNKDVIASVSLQFIFNITNIMINIK